MDNNAQTPSQQQAMLSALLLPFLEQQQRQLGSVEQQLEKLTEVVQRIALLEERRSQDRQVIEKLDTAVTLIKDTQSTKHPQYDEMLDSYKQFKKAVITVICSGLLAAVLAVSTGTVKLGG